MKKTALLGARDARIAFLRLFGELIGVEDAATDERDVRRAIGAIRELREAPLFGSLRALPLFEARFVRVAQRRRIGIDIETLCAELCIDPFVDSTGIGDRLPARNVLGTLEESCLALGERAL